MKAKTNILLLCLWLFFLVAIGLNCNADNDSEGGDDNSGSVTLEGAVAKGPFSVGSSVDVAMIDSITTDPLGTVFNTTTRNDLGEYNLNLNSLGTAEIVANGFYFNEIKGQLSSAAITMRALAEFSSSGTQQVYINIVTQLTYLRAKYLIVQGTAFQAAIAQAEAELSLWTSGDQRSR